MPDHIQNRERIITGLLDELVGPAPAGPERDLTGAVVITERTEAYGPFRELGTGEEILTRDAPTRRYGVAVLYPLGAADGVVPDDSVELSNIADASDLPVSEDARGGLDEILDRASRRGDARDNSPEFDLSASSGFRPSSMAVSFLIAAQPDDRLKLTASGGVYRPVDVEVEGKKREWWVRRSVRLEAEIAGADLSGRQPITPECLVVEGRLPDGLKLGFEVYARPWGEAKRLLTVCLINRSAAEGRVDPLCLFQAGFDVSVDAKNGNAAILPYPAAPISNLDEEEQGLELLYLTRKTFAVGHGCAAEWETSGREKCYRVRAVAVPLHETPSMTPDVVTPNGERLEIPMALLASGSDEGFKALTQVAIAYRAWINDRQSEIKTLAVEYRPAAERHLEQCRICANRIDAGIEFLRDNPTARVAFKLANAAILFQQLNSGREARKIAGGGGPRQFSEPFVVPGVQDERAQKPKWRAFQIAFLLMSLRSAVDSKDEDRDTVELIWFPTGGGKTEAYLGLAAFGAFFRRLTDQNDDGVHVLMRYTLRLLTAQQFQRAARLICAMEFLRRQNRDLLGEAAFSIGIWLGGETTPNKRADAVAMLKRLVRGEKYADNGFLLDRCPWCRAEMGVVKLPGGQTKIIGYEQRGNTVAFCCSDQRCAFEKELPVYVIDEDIYERRPTLLIGTVDKFASLAWKPEARAIFGLADGGERISTPPSVIIQDELHLISGPLGSVVGLYEVLIEDLCTDRRNGRNVKPKIVCSTATIRRYQEQVLALYGRQSVQLFPPPGLDASDSFFARYATREDGTLERGRMYLGIYGPGLGSIQTAQVRTFASVLAASLPLNAAERDPWWTLLVFFNSLRELGGTVSLLQSDIPDYLRTIRNRTGGAEQRYLNNVLELTSRLTKEEIPQALRSLEMTTDGENKYPVDVCLASSIVEVGVDIDRLSLMALVGQPKTTAQYIQVSGRVGRQWKERPGIVITIYGVAKARDRSHFERFRSYHERLYAQVEPTSVTPFSQPVVDRALHAVMAGFVRQSGANSQAQSPDPCPTWVLDRLLELLAARVKKVDEDELPSVEAAFKRRIGEWKKWGPRIWSSFADDGEIPLLRAAGAYTPPDWVGRSWSTPQSMRNVDAECQAEITTLYS